MVHEQIGDAWECIQIPRNSWKSRGIFRGSRFFLYQVFVYRGFPVSLRSFSLAQEKFTGTSEVTTCHTTLQGVMGSTIKIAVGQMSKRIKAKVLFLPEASDYISRDAAHSAHLAKQTKADFVDVIREKLKAVYSRDVKNALSVAVGVHEPASGGDSAQKVRNNQLWISARGEIKQRYQKIHLFDVNIPNGPILQESKCVEAGSKIVEPFPMCETAHPGFKVGLAICYDLRFPEMAIRLRERGANILTYASAFSTQTGEAHWLQLGRARAIDSQCFVVMAAQCGQHDVYADVLAAKRGPEDEVRERREQRVSYGQSVIISPWGEILTKGPTYLERGGRAVDDEGDYCEIFDADLDLEHLRKVRMNLPVFSHRRPDIFKA